MKKGISHVLLAGWVWGQLAVGVNEGKGATTAPPTPKYLCMAKRQCLVPERVYPGAQEGRSSEKQRHGQKPGDERRMILSGFYGR